MTDILISVLNMSATASIVAIAVIIVRLPLKKAPKIFSYALWAVVFLRLVCPISFESPASFMPTNGEIIPYSVIYEPIPHIESGVPVLDEPLNMLIENSLPETNPVISVNPVQTALYIATYVWLLGIVALLSYAVIGYVRLKRRVYDATIEYDNIYRTDKVTTAFVLGLAHPRIYIPLCISGAQFEHILRHEQVHIKRRDYLIKPLAFIILAVHWFNPVVWISYYLMSKDMEMSCDEAVLRCSEDDLRQDYSMSLMNLYTRKPALLSPLAFGEGSYYNMKARIKNVLKFKKAPRWVIMVCSLALVMFMVGFTTNPPQNLSADALSIANNVPALKQETLQYLGITAYALDGKWAAASSIEGGTWQSQIDDEIKWLNDTYAENKTDFVITESLAASEASDVSRINYLYDNSDLFRSMSSMDNGVFAVENDQTFTRSGHSLNADFVHRTAVMTSADGEITLDIDYNLIQGKMAVWLIDQDGTVVYQGSANTVYKGSHTVTGKNGLWSVIRVYEGSNASIVSGNIAISLRQGNGANPSSSLGQRYEGGVAANNMQYGNPFPASKRDVARFSLDSELWGWGLNKDDIVIRLVVGGNDGTTQEIVLSNEEPTKEIVIKENASHHITIHNPNMQLVNYNFVLTINPSSENADGLVPAPESATMPLAESSQPQPYFQIISKNGKNVTSSGSFIAGTGQRLIITSESSITGGTVDLFLFSPSGNEQRFTFGGTNKTETVELTAGTWAYNCSGIYESGSIVIIGSTSVGGKQADTKLQAPPVSRTASLIQNFEKYTSYGVYYDAEQDAVFYNGEQVKLFVEFHDKKEKGMTFAFEFCHQDGNTESTLCLEAVKDDNGNITGIRQLDEKIAREILNDMKQSTLKSDTEAPDTSFMTMDATTELLGSRITATDKGVTKNNVPQHVKDWIAQCDKTQGAFFLTSKSGDSYVTYAYYNGGGRFPWNITADSDSVSLHWLSNSNFAADDGYCLMYFTAPKEYTSIKLYLDDKQLNNA